MDTQVLHRIIFNGIKVLQDLFGIIWLVIQLIQQPQLSLLQAL